MMTAVEKATVKQLRVAVPEITALRDTQILQIVRAVQLLGPIRPPADSFLSERDVADWLDVAPAELSEMFGASGPQPVGVLPVRYRAGDVSKWLDGRKTSDNSDYVRAV